MGKYSPTSEDGNDGGLSRPRAIRKVQRRSALDVPLVPRTVKFTMPCPCGMPMLPGEKDCPRCVHGAHW